jgi:hypothetical protein
MSLQPDEIGITIEGELASHSWTVSAHEGRALLALAFACCGIAAGGAGRVVLCACAGSCGLWRLCRPRLNLHSACSPGCSPLPRGRPFHSCKTELSRPLFRPELFARPRGSASAAPGTFRRPRRSVGFGPPCVRCRCPRPQLLGGRTRPVAARSPGLACLSPSTLVADLLPALFARASIARHSRPCALDLVSPCSQRRRLG